MTERYSYMDTKRIEKLLVLIILFLIINIAITFKPYNIQPHVDGGAIRINSYTGTVIFFNIYGEPIKRISD
jgi:hypothetical protein